MDFFQVVSITVEGTTWERASLPPMAVTRVHVEVVDRPAARRWRVSMVSTYLLAFRSFMYMYIYCENITLPNQLKCKCDLLKSRTHSCPLDEKFIKNGEIGPVADQIYEIWNFAIFVIWVFKRKSKLCIHTKHSSLKINLHE